MRPFTRDVAKVATANTLDIKWRNRATCVINRVKVEAFRSTKGTDELDDCLNKEIWASIASGIAVRYVYEWRDDIGNWFLSSSNLKWSSQRLNAKAGFQRI